LAIANAKTSNEINVIDNNGFGIRMNSLNPFLASDKYLDLKEDVNQIQIQVKD